VRREIEEQLRSVGAIDGVLASTSFMPPNAGQPEFQIAARPALSRMKKSELKAECEERSLPAKGTVAELRAALRVERKRDVLVAQVVERGWPEKQARAALMKAEWDFDVAIKKLVGS
jgi:hypothetical protein